MGAAKRTQQIRTNEDWLFVATVHFCQNHQNRLPVLTEPFKKIIDVTTLLILLTWLHFISDKLGVLAVSSTYNFSFKLAGKLKYRTCAASCDFTMQRFTGSDVLNIKTNGIEKVFCNSSTINDLRSQRVHLRLIIPAMRPLRNLEELSSSLKNSVSLKICLTKTQI